MPTNLTELVAKSMWEATHNHRYSWRNKHAEDETEKYLLMAEAAIKICEEAKHDKSN